MPALSSFAVPRADRPSARANHPRPAMAASPLFGRRGSSSSFTPRTVNLVFTDDLAPPGSVPAGSLMTWVRGPCQTPWRAFARCSQPSSRHPRWISGRGLATEISPSFSLTVFNRRGGHGGSVIVGMLDMGPTDPVVELPLAPILEGRHVHEAVEPAAGQTGHRRDRAPSPGRRREVARDIGLVPVDRDHALPLGPEPVRGGCPDAGCRAVMAIVRGSVVVMVVIVPSALARVTPLADRRGRRAHRGADRRGGAAGPSPPTPGPVTGPGAARSRPGGWARPSRRHVGRGTAAPPDRWPGARPNSFSTSVSTACRKRRG